MRYGITVFEITMYQMSDSILPEKVTERPSTT